MAKEINLELQRRQVAKAFYINGDEGLLLEKIKVGDMAALVQLAMLHMPYIISCALPEQHQGLSLTDLIDAATHGFIAAAEKAANEKAAEVNGMYTFMHRKITDALLPVPEKNSRRIKYDTPKHIACLNHLNRMLTEKEKEVTARAITYLNLAEQRIKGKDSFTTDYNLELEVFYYAKGHNGDPMHKYCSNATYENKSGGNIFGLLCSSEDWRESYMPVLDAPYCYLLHDLIDHSRISNKLFSISGIWFDIRFTDQHCMELLGAV